MAHLTTPDCEIGADDDLAAALNLGFRLSGSGSYDRLGRRNGGIPSYGMVSTYEMVAGDNKKPSRLYEVFNESISFDNSEDGNHPSVTVGLDKQVGDQRTIVDEMTLTRVLPKQYSRVYNAKEGTIIESFKSVAYELDNSDADIAVELEPNRDRFS